ncbi:ExbD/TolR family protein [Altererythrobacter sp. MF3-039]|uniref:ExbD/TolR family protein n=1 Tax=Altererythrobacter sp. MF3-039 TaxID=3252901 RepID=UPI00390C6395
MAMGIQTMGRRRRGGRRAPMAEINVTPFVDVMLVLLIIFMVTAPLLTSGVPLELPDSRANALPSETEQVTVSITDDGTIFVDDMPVGIAELPGALAAVRPTSGDNLPQVSLRADRVLNYGLVMAVMGEFNRAGFNSISLVTNSAAEAVEAEATVSDGSDDEP